MKNMYLKCGLTFATSFALTGATYAVSPAPNSPFIFLDGFEAPLPFVKTACGFYDKDSKLTWSLDSYVCAFNETNYGCLERVNVALQCKGRIPSLAELKTIIDMNATPKSKIPNAKTDAMTVSTEMRFYPAVVIPGRPTPTGVVGINFKTGKVVDYFFGDKRYARLVITSS